MAEDLSRTERHEMSDLFGFSSYGMLGDPRAMTEAEINALTRWNDLRPAQASCARIMGMANYRPFDTSVIERDERFGYCYEALK